MLTGGAILGFLIAAIIIVIVFVAVYFTKKNALTNAEHMCPYKAETLHAEK